MNQKAKMRGQIYFDVMYLAVGLKHARSAFTFLADNALKIHVPTTRRYMYYCVFFLILLLR